MKHHLFVFFCGTLLLILASCAEQAVTQYHIGVSQCSDDAWRTKFNEELNRELLFHPGYSLEVRSADDDNAKQMADIDYFIEQHVDLIIVAPNEADVLTPAVSRAYDAGIPIIIADRKVTGQKYTAFVGGDNLAVGRLMGTYLRMKLPEGGKVLEILGLEGSTPASLRHRGMVEQLGADYQRYEWVQCAGNWFKELGRQVADSILQLHPDVKFIMAQNDQMAIGASQAVKERITDHDVIIMGVDGLAGPGNGVEAIAEGLIDASAVYATAGDVVMQTAVKILEGQPYERNTELATYLIQPDAAPMMNNFWKEVNHQVETVQMLKGRVDYYWEQHNLEKTLLYSLGAILLLVIGFIVVLYRNYYQKQLLNESLHRQRDQLKEHRDQLTTQNHELKRLSEELNEATQAKLRFFTNVSHDFRTPLTLISAPIEQLQHAGNLSGEQLQYVQLAHKNVQVLLRLVNQILDFRKYESGKLELNLQALRLDEAVRSWHHSFEGLSYKKHIKMSLDIAEGDAAVYHTMADIAKTERIFFNLMGNAFKFTPENGRISISLARTGSQFTLRIADTGPGINIEHINHIFENFYQVDSVHHEGSGIGLALVKNFVELQGGTISVENQPEGTGTIFTVTLPARQVDPSLAEQEQQRATALSPMQVEMELADVIEPQEIKEDDPKPAVLVIDDNPDILSLLRTILSADYHVFTARNGQEGISKAMRIVPNVIVCDVMMPGMDGMECCRRLKSEVNTYHIPVVMLTACSLDEQRIEGHQQGADAYLSKPFNNQVLLAQIEALIKSHDKVRDFFNGETFTPTPTEGKPVVETLDDQFLQKVRQSIVKHLNDAGFGVEQMSDELSMSRAQLYRKVKALTNYSPVELIRNTRLKQARQMLAQGSLTIAEVAYSVGFTAPSYFTKCYKEYFGENPNELHKRQE